MEIRYRICKVCDRKRRFHVTHESHGPENPGRRWMCSKGHTFWVAWTTLEKSLALLKDNYLPTVRRLFETESMFYKVVHGHAR